MLEDLLNLRAATSRIGKEYASKAKHAETARDAREIMLQGMKELEAHFLYALRFLDVYCNMNAVFVHMNHLGLIFPCYWS